MNPDSAKLHFSNSILRGYLDYIRRYRGDAGLQILSAELGVDPDWLNNDKAWHSAELHSKFQAQFRKMFSDRPSVIADAVMQLWAEKKVGQRFNSLAGVLVTPEVLFKKLPEAAKRMNHYNSYSFTMVSTGVYLRKGRLTQTYLEAEQTQLNLGLCDASRGSISGVMQFFGHRLIDLRESKCVGRGDTECQYEITWVNQPFWAAFMIFGGLMVGGKYGLGLLFPQMEARYQWLLAGMASAILIAVGWLVKTRRTLNRVFEFQQQTLEDLRGLVAANELLNARLLDYQRQMSQAMTLASIGEMSFSFVHDMASPTMLLSFYSEELASTIKTRYPNEKQILTFSTAIEKATGKLLKLQALFRSSAKSSVSENRVYVRFAEVIEDCIDVFRPFIERNRILCDLKVSDPQLGIETYEGCLETIILNLIQNALNVLVRSPRRALSVTQRCLESGEVEIRIHDSGPGIPAERLASLWERFGSSNSSTGATKGSGFGMYNIKKIVDRMGGKIDVETGSAGTCFILVFRASGEPSSNSDKKKFSDPT